MFHIKKSIKQGDIVEVLSLEEIKKTLDSKRRCDNLPFMPGMAKFSNRRFIVFKRVSTIFDERAWKMVRLKDTVLLQDVLCDGKDYDGIERCQRLCYYYWKEQWLKRVVK